MLKTSTFGAFALFCIALGVVRPASAQEAMAVFANWRLFVEGAGGAKQCFIVGEPGRSQPSKVKRGDVFLTIAHRPGQGVRDEISVQIGYPFSASSNPFAKVGSDQFDFFTGVQAQNGADDRAWLENLVDQPRLVNAMKRGNELIFKATSARGTLTTDSYSLRGVTAAMKALDAACPAP
jgi:invasion protein IalB